MAENQKNFYTKKIRSLEKTQKFFNESQSLSGVELKEFSLIYLIINNLNLMRDHIHLLQDIKLFSEVNKQIFEKIFSSFLFEYCAKMTSGFSI